MTRYYEDLEIRDTFETGDYTVTKEEIISFAEQFDPQPFHVDEEAAQDSMFGELVASGMHTLCISTRLFITEFVQGAEGLANMGGLGMDDLRWHAPVFPDDTLYLTIEVLDKKPLESRSDGGRVDFRLRVFNSDEKVLSNSSYNVVRHRSTDE
jgi:acyl dehydratase